MKKQLVKIYNWPFLSKEETNKNQKIIRDVEWEAIEPYIIKGKFLDVGCGAGYSMIKAGEIGCSVYGLDPDPGGHGVGRSGSNFILEKLEITKGSAENIPFENETFDTVYSSHVLEHVENEQKSLKEMARVLKQNGVLIIGMPTSHMAWINFFIHTILTVHQRIINYLASPFINTGKITFRQLFFPSSHSHHSKSVFYDIKKYKIANWQKVIEQEFKIEKVLKPAFYPFPETIQFFKLKKNNRFTSSVFFICKKY